MTWEDVYDVLCESAIDDTSPLGREVMLLLKAELGDCIIIKKGENRHPYADVIHAFAEGARTEIMDNGFWINYFPYGLGAEYRIKPSEPVYEWQWDTKLPDNTWRYYIKGDQTHFTDEEIGHEANWLCKVEHTKRERKND